MTDTCVNKLSAVVDCLQQTQDKICQALEQEETASSRFQEDAWTKDAVGHGRTRVLSGGDIFEQAGVNFSYVAGKNLPPAATKNRPDIVGSDFHAAGISLVIHPNNPYVPTSHANFRFFMAEPKNQDPVWWFGGGFDLTPYYGFLEDCQHWHRTAKAACDPFGETVYDEYKKQCDEYFYLKHRGEARGIGGLFFDDVNEWGFEKSFDFIQKTAQAYLDAYLPIVQSRKAHPFGEAEKAFQHYRRGRYVEFNLIYDRGTLFGLQFGGRTESILMSLPPKVEWRYNWKPEAGTPEAKLYDEFLPARDWV